MREEMKRTCLRTVAALGVFCLMVLLLSLPCGCSNAAIDTRYIRTDQAASTQGPESRGATVERSRTITIQKAGPKP